MSFAIMPALSYSPDKHISKSIKNKKGKKSRISGIPLMGVNSGPIPLRRSSLGDCVGLGDLGRAIGL